MTGWSSRVIQELESMLTQDVIVSNMKWSIAILSWKLRRSMVVFIWFGFCSFIRESQVNQRLVALVQPHSRSNYLFWSFGHIISNWPTWFSMLIVAWSQKCSCQQENLYRSCPYSSNTLWWWWWLVDSGLLWLVRLRELSSDRLGWRGYSFIV